MNKNNYYDKISQIYDQTRWLTESVAAEVADFMIKLVSATPKTSFLEPGVGTGLNVIPLVKRGYSVTGIDISEQMLNQFRQKLNGTPENLTLVHADASQLPFENGSFDVVLTVHMLHTVSDRQIFLNEIDRVLKPKGFFLNCQWITPPARREFEAHFRAIQSKYESKHSNSAPESKSPVHAIEEVDLEQYLRTKGYQSNYFIAKEWKVSNTIAELLDFYKSRAYGLCWQVPQEDYNKAIAEFEQFCTNHYGSLEKVISSVAKFEIWAYRHPTSPSNS
ncbi:type 11 methyltransferase [Calothrix sp. NIES-4101]|nr:type 11 methyltransferase [Calothrix sp. NIES-4101]